MGLWLALLVIFLHSVSSKFEYKTPVLEKEYDYIIVGAGSAGSVIANRLSENETVKVLLLEAGGHPSGLSEIALFAILLQGSSEDWGYVTEPQTNAFLGFKNQVSPMSRHKALGGCSDHNYMVYTRGNKQDYDRWALNGAKGWSWKDVLPYFIKSEDQKDQTLLSEGYHGVGGYQTISPAQYLSESALPLMKAAEKTLGLKPGDYNGASQNVISPIQTFQRDGLRCSTEKAFLRPAASRENLHILTYAHVTKVNIDENMRARSVTFDRNNETTTVFARKEIILSAGAVGTPQLLLVSGIGPRQDLEALGIRNIIDLPVGKNLQDHITAYVQYYQVNDTTGIVFPKVSTPENIGLLQEGKGPLTSTCTIELTGYINTKYQNASENWPDIQLFSLSTLYAPPLETVKTEVVNKFSKYFDQPVRSFFPVIMRPKSRGFVKLRTSDIYDHPIIDPKYLSEKEDVERLIEGMKKVDDWIQGEEFQQFQPKRILDDFSVCNGLTAGSDAYYECVIRFLPLSVFHPCCTCKMGNVSDNTTVVDPELRVKGITGLRVADASIMTTIVSGNTNAACIMIGEKAADMIRGKS